LIVRIGWLTISFGRVIDFLLGVYSGTQDSSNKSRLVSAQQVVWFFPSESRYPFTSNLLKKKGLILKSHFFFGLLYRLVSRLNFHSMLDSTSNYELRFHENRILSPKCLQESIVNSFHIDEICNKHSFFSQLQLGSDDLCLIYFRNEDWDTSVYGKGSSILNNERHRNTAVDCVQQLVEMLTNENYLVARIGRDNREYEESNKFLNYAAKHFRCDELDLYLWSKAKCILTSSGGADEPRLIFGTPTMFLNPPEPLGRYFIEDLWFPVCFLPPIYLHENGGRATLSDLSEGGIMPDSTKPLKNIKNSEFCLMENSVEDTVLASRDFVRHVRERGERFINFQGMEISRRWGNLPFPT